MGSPALMLDKESMFAIYFLWDSLAVLISHSQMDQNFAQFQFSSQGTSIGLLFNMKAPSGEFHQGGS